MKISQLVYNLRNQLKISRPDDINISDRQIEFMIDYLREKLLVQHLEKNRSISGNIRQDLGNLELIRLSPDLQRTKNIIPQPIELNDYDLITYVGGYDKESGIPLKPKSYIRWNKFNKYTGHQELCYFDGGYIYVHGCKNPNLKWINIEGVFLHPTEVSNFTLPDGRKSYTPDVDNYPLSGRFVDMIDQLIKKQELGEFLQIVENQTNNADTQS